VRDAVLLGALLISFATLITAHVAIAVRLALHARPRYRGIVAFVVPPLAPYWAHAHGFRKTCWLWVSAVTCYALAVVLAAATNH
jgi:hypothetical protein